VEADVIVRAAHVQTKWASVTNAQFTAHWFHSLTNAIPISGRGKCRDHGRHALGQRQLALHRQDRRSPNPPPANSSWAWWIPQPYLLDWECEWTGLQSEKLLRKEARAQRALQSPTLSQPHVELHSGTLDTAATLTWTRNVTFEMASTLT
jgi:hypothetical protein